MCYTHLQHVFNNALDFGAICLSRYVDDVFALEVSWLRHDGTVIGLVA